MSASEDEYSVDQEDFNEDGVEDDDSYDDGKADLMDNDDDSSDDDVNDGNGGLKVTAWGNKKKEFYNEDEGKQSDEEAGFEEEEEANLIENLQKDRLTEGEFFDVILDNKKTKKHVIDVDKLEDEEEVALFSAKRLAEIQKLDDYEKYEILKKESPELISIINEMKKYLKEVKYRYYPLLVYLQSAPGLKNSQGKKFVEVKFELLLSYCMNLTFYIALKHEGKSLKDHPILKKLVNLKRQLARLMPIDKSLEPELDALLKKAERQNGYPEPETSSKNGTVNANGKSKQTVKENKKEKQHKITNLYRNNDSSSLTLKEKLEGGKKKQKKSALQPKHDKSDDSVEDNQFEDPLRDIDDDEDERARIRFVEKGDKKSLKQQKNNKSKNKSGADDFNDFDDDDLDLDGLDDIDFGESDDEPGQKQPKAKQTKTLSDHLNKRKYREMKKEAEQDDQAQVGDELYRQMKKVKKDKKDSIQQQKQEEHEAKFLHDNDIVDQEDGVRRISSTIQRNKGLQRRRPKENKNSRVKLRNKYDSALKKMKSKGVHHRDKTQGYQWEQSGIRGGLIRSTKFNT